MNTFALDGLPPCGGAGLMGFSHYLTFACPKERTCPKRNCLSLPSEAQDLRTFSEHLTMMRDWELESLLAWELAVLLLGNTYIHLHPELVFFSDRCLLARIISSCYCVCYIGHTNLPTKHSTKPTMLTWLAPAYSWEYYAQPHLDGLTWPGLCSLGLFK